MGDDNKNNKNRNSNNNINKMGEGMTHIYLKAPPSSIQLSHSSLALELEKNNWKGREDEKKDWSKEICFRFFFFHLAEMWEWISQYSS